jgi:hypothetical protein
VEADEGELPEAMRTEGLLEAEREQEPLEVVEPVEGGEPRRPRRQSSSPK